MSFSHIPSFYSSNVNSFSSDQFENVSSMNLANQQILDVQPQASSMSPENFVKGSLSPHLTSKIENKVLKLDILRISNDQQPGVPLKSIPANPKNFISPAIPKDLLKESLSPPPPLASKMKKSICSLHIIRIPSAQLSNDRVTLSKAEPLFLDRRGITHSYSLGPQVPAE